MKVAKRIDTLPSYVFAELGRRILQMKAQGRDVIRLDIGSPDLPAPNSVVSALERSLRDPSHHGYGGYYGTPELRQAMAIYYERRFGVQVSPDREVAPLIGSKEGIANIALAFVDPGESVLVPDPGYPTYSMGTILAGGVPVRMPLRQENDFLPDLEAIPHEIARSAKIMWLNYPNNPTGAVAPLRFLEQAVAFARRYSLLICHDNPYCDVVFDDYTAPSILQVPGAMEVAVEFNSLSKTYNMAGWRVGMAVGNAVAVEALARTKTNIDSGIFIPIQDAAVEALTGDQSWLADRNRIYRERRDLILATLRDMGIQASTSKASLYIWARVPADYSSTDFAARLLEDAAVSVTPGDAFGCFGEGFVRISLGMDTERIRAAMERLKQLHL